MVRRPSTHRTGVVGAPDALRHFSEFARGSDLTVSIGPLCGRKRSCLNRGVDAGTPGEGGSPRPKWVRIRCRGGPCEAPAA